MEFQPKRSLVSVDKEEMVLVKPSEPTPSEVLSLSTIDNNPDLEVICQTIYVYRAKSDPISFSNGQDHHDVEVSRKSPEKPDPAVVVKEALSRVLVHYYPLAGKIKRQSDGALRITCSNADAGVPFLEASCDCELSYLEYLDGADIDTLKEFILHLKTPESESDQSHADGYHPLVLQVTKFSCGGFTIGMGLSHSICDGFGAIQFFRAITELASGMTEPSIKPIWERDRLLGKPSQGPVHLLVDKASLATSPLLPTTELVHKCFNVDAESITKLKLSLSKQETEEDAALQEKFTTLEVLGAYVWRARSRALKLNPDGKTVLCFAVGARKLTKPPLPSGFYGNAFLALNVVLKARELNEEPLLETAKRIKDSKKITSHPEYVTESLNFLETVRQQSVKLVEISGPTTVLTDWRQLGLLEEVDFGWNSSVNLVSLAWDMFNYVDLCIFMPPCRMNPLMKGGVKVLVSLPAAAMAVFKEEMDALRTGEW